MSCVRVGHGYYRYSEYASPEMKNNEEVVLEAVQQNGHLLHFAGPDMKNNEQVVLAAVTKHLPTDVSFSNQLHEPLFRIFVLMFVKMAEIV